MPEITGGGNGKGGLSTAHRFIDLDRRQGFARSVSTIDSYAPLTAAECMKGSALGEKEERGVAVKGNSHMQYNADGQYIREAACFVYRRWVASQKGAK